MQLYVVCVAKAVEVDKALTGAGARVLLGRRVALDGGGPGFGRLDGRFGFGGGCGSRLGQGGWTQHATTQAPPSAVQMH